MLKFYIVLENGSHHILEFKGLREFHKYSRTHYISEIKTLDTDSTYSFTDAEGVTVSDLEGVK